MSIKPDYPLLLEPMYKEKVWGGRQLENLGRTLPAKPDATIGESWELADLAQTSASGGGGDAASSRIANGPLAGKTLANLIANEAQRAALLGPLPLSPEGGFPLLLKYLDASQNLSVQVHPSPAYAATHADAFLKSEAWYIVDCAPDAVIYKGIRDGVRPDQLRAALAENTDEAVVPLMVSVPVKPGDCHYLPSGTCHALGGGVLVAEVQTPSDTTFRVYDWGRTGRELHVDAAMACIDFHPADTARFEPNHSIADGPIHGVRRVACEFFRIDQFDLEANANHALIAGEPIALMVLAGRVRVTSDRGEDFEAAAGSTLLVPAGATSVLIESCGQASRLLQVSFPEAQNTQIA